MVSFVRPLTPSDVSKGYDYSVSISADTKIIWALGSLDSSLNPSQHGSGMDGAYQINFQTNTYMKISDEDEASSSFGSFFSRTLINLSCVATLALYAILA